MSTITLPRTEYINLKSRAEAFDKMVAEIQPSLLFAPTEKSRKKVITEFSKTKLYNKKFLESLNRGLKRSSFFTK